MNSAVASDADTCSASSELKTEAEAAATGRPATSRLSQLRKSVRGYRELEKVAAEFRGRAAIAMSARELREEAA